MRYAIIESGKVTNIIDAPSGFSLDGVTMVQSNTAGIGWSYSNGTFTAPPAAPDPGNPTLYPGTMILQSPDGTPFMLSVDNDGKVSSDPL